MLYAAKSNRLHQASHIPREHELKHLKDAGSEWCSLAETSIVMPASKHNITARSDSPTTMSEYRHAVAFPYITALKSNINSCESPGIIINL